MTDDQLPAFESADEISRKIAEIDELIGLQLDEILHHPEFKALEAAWRGIFYLVSQIEYNLRVKIHIFQAGKKDLRKDFERSPEPENSSLYKKVFADIYGGGHLAGFGMLVGAYEFDGSAPDVIVLEKMRELAALAHAPFIAGVAPSMFDWESFEQAQESDAWSNYCRSPAHDWWNDFRRTEAARFAGLCLPHILLREPYETAKNFTYRESAEKSDLLWGNAAFAFAGCVAKAYYEKSWLGKMGGSDGDGAVENLPSQTDYQNHEFSLDADLRNHSPAISDLGFMSLIDDTGGRPYFFDSRSTIKPPVYDTPGMTEISSKWAKLEHVFSVTRFAVNLMSFRRDNYYRFEGRRGWETALNRWLEQYYPLENNAPDEVKAARPLREFRIDVSERPGSPNLHTGVLFIRPAYLLDDIDIAMRTVIYFLI